MAKMELEEMATCLCLVFRDECCLLFFFGLKSLLWLFLPSILEKDLNLETGCFVKCKKER